MATAPAAIRPSAAGVILSVAVKVRASRTAVLGLKDEVLQVALAAPPVDGAANEALRRALADHFGLAKSAVTIVGGEKSRRKQVELAGVDVAQARARLSSG